MNGEHLVEDPKPRFAPWLLEPMRRNSATYWKVALAAALVNIFTLLTSLFSMIVYDRVLPNNAISSLIGLTIGLIIILVFDFILKMLRAYFVDIAGADIDRDVGGNVFGRLLAMRLELKKGSTGAMAGLMRELEAIRDFFASATLLAVVDVPFILLTLVVIALIGGPVALVPAILVPLVILVGWLTQPALDRLTAQSMREGLVKQSVLVETIGGLETVKAAGAGPLLAGRWMDAVEHQSDSSMRQRMVAAIATTFAGSAGVIAYSGIVIVGVFEIGAGNMTMGALIACSILGSRAIAPLGQIAQLLSRLTATKTAYRQIKALMDQPVEGPVGEGIKLAAPQGGIELRNVTFRYPGAAEPSLNEVSLKIEPGERVAVLGRVGSGKSTLARLILGLYPPEDGLVMLDGTDIRQLDTSFRRGMGAALQESVLLTGTIRENIVLGREGVDDAELMRVSELSGAHQFVGRTANGYDLRLADRGEGLSGGQRQAIALARALVGKPQLVVLDEPTSAMDSQSESALLQRLAVELKGRTLVLITHRPQLMQLVDRIIVLDAGKVMMDGPRDAVLRKLSPPKAVA
ncbi:type I secretion system permease/ATPase [Sphingomonas sp. LT1P40]|uniref:type I secretion system permease/ATPase n=1 Tax=Alteristakelama amylovorans TaxID=3096166 RepID=UPI002FC76F98